MAPPADRAAPRPPLTRGGVLARLALYVVSFSLWLLLAVASTSRPVRIVGGLACVLPVLLTIALVRRALRELRAAPCGK